MALTLAFLPLEEPNTTTQPMLAPPHLPWHVTLGVGTNLLDSPVNSGWPMALSAILRPL